MKKHILILFFLIFSFTFNQADAFIINPLDKIVQKANFGLKSQISINIIDKEGKTFYSYRENKPLNAASAQKLATFALSYLTLGKDYKFETALYKYNNDIYLKLGADTHLSYNDLEKLFKELKQKIDTTKIQNIYIDDSIIDKTPYPKLWLEEDMWPRNPMITPYIVDNNMTEIAIKRSSLATKTDIIQNGDYKFPIINELAIGDIHKYQIKRKYENSQILNFEGTIAKDEIIMLPVLMPELNFNIKLIKAIDKNNIGYLKKITVKKTPANAKKIASVSHSIDEISKDILYYSNNITSEIVFLAAAAKYINYSHPATFEDTIKMWNDCFKDIVTPDIKIYDASGISKENLLTSNFITQIIKKYYLNPDLKELLPTSNQGTLQERLLFLQNNLKAKTGSRIGASSLSGIFTTQDKKELIFSIIIQSSKRRALMKNFENTIIGYIYRKY